MTRSESDVTVNVQDLVRFLLRGLVWAALVGGGVGAGMYAYLLNQEPTFRAESTVLVTGTTPGLGDFGLTPATAPRLDLTAYRAAASSDQVLLDALRRLGTLEPDPAAVRELRSSTDAFIRGDGRDSGLLGVAGEGSTPDVAVARGNALTDALVDWDRRRATEGLTRVLRMLEAQIDALSEQIRAMQAIGDGDTDAQVAGLIRLRADQQQQLAYARALAASSEGLLSVIQPAVSAWQTAPRPVTDTAMAVLLAIVLTYGVLLIRSALNTRLRSVEEVMAVSGMPLLAMFPRVGGPKDGWRMQEAASYLRSNVLFATPDAHPKVLLVTSAGEHEGKTTIACELAEGFAKNGYRTLLVDADLRAPTVAEHFDVIDTGPIVTTTRDWLTGAGSARSVLKVTLDDGIDLHVVPQYSSVKHAAEVLGRGFAQALDQWGDYDVILVDSSPVLAVADALAIAPLCSGTLVVFDAQRTVAKTIVRTREMLVGVGANVLGAVANRARRPANTGDAYAGVYGRRYGRTPDRLPRAAGRAVERNAAGKPGLATRSG